MVQLQHPWALLGLLLIPLAALILLWRGRPVEIPVPSILHWKDLPETDAAATRRIRWESMISLILVSLAIGTLVLALAHPTWIAEEGEGRALIILDRSVSMRTRDGEGTRLDRAEEAIRDLREEWRGTVDVRTIALPDRGEIPAIIPGEKAFLFTDRVPAWAADLGVAVASFGAPSDNLGITELEVDRGTLFVAVGNFTAEDRDVPIVAEGEGFLLEDTIRVLAGDEAPWVMEIPPLEKVTVRIDPGDSLDLDDRVELHLGKPGEFLCRLEGDASPSMERVLQAIPGVEVGGEGIPRLAIYHRQVPEGDPDWPVVLIDPPGGTADPVAGEQEIIAAEGDWEDIAFSGVKVASPRPVGGEGWEPVLRALPSGETVAAVRGRVLALGFDLEEGTNWPLRISFPVFWARVAEWAGLSAGEGRSLRAGEPMTFDVDFTPTRLVGPRGRTLEVYEERGPRVFLPGAFGPHTLVDRAGERVFSVNLLRRDESDNGGDRRDLTEEERRVPLRGERRGEGWPFLVVLFIIFAALEWARRRERIRP